MKIAKKILKIFLIALASLIILFFLVMGISRAINYSKHKIRSSDGIDKGEFITLGNMEQYIRIRSENRSSPVIIYLHGGPGSPDSYVSYVFADYLDEDYTMVFWDQRGSGRTYEHNMKTDPDNNTVSFEQSLTDLDELVDMMCERFGQDKVVIMGHSYGSLLGGNYVYRHPEKVSHYIGVGQSVYFPDGEQRSFEDAMEQAKAAGDDTSEMEAAWNEYHADMSDFKKMLPVRNYTYKYHTAPKQANQMWLGISSPYMGTADLRYFMRQMNIDGFLKLQDELMHNLAHDINMNQFTDYKLPVDLIMGQYDWTCPTVCAQEYLEKISAPEKGFHIIDGCGHSPQFDDPESFARIVKDIIKDKD